MSQRIIESTGGIAYAGFYYPEIFAELLQYMRRNRERLGLTDENIYEVHVQLLSAFAHAAHNNNVHLDSVATEMFLDSAQMLQSVKNLLALQGIHLRSAQPAVADLVCQISAPTSVDQTDFVPVLSEFETADIPTIVYENLEAVDLDRTDRVYRVYAHQVIAQAANPTEFVSVQQNSDVVERGSGTWPVDIVGKEIFLYSLQLGNNSGFFRVTSRLSATEIRVATVPDLLPPAFFTETGIPWGIYEFSADYSTPANGAGVFTPFGVNATVNDALYVGHRQVMQTRADFVFDTSIEPALSGIFEYYDNKRSIFYPKAVENNGSTLTFDLTPLLTANNAQGALIFVENLKTRAREYLFSQYSIFAPFGASPVNHGTTLGLLGQVVVSTDPSDYRITADWVPFSNVSETMSDNGSDLINNGLVSWDLPQEEERSWLPVKVNAEEAYWFRFRVTDSLGANRPTIDSIRIDQGQQSITFPVVQGVTAGSFVVGSSNGQASQEFLVQETPYLDDTETVEVDETGVGVLIPYRYVPSLNLSSATDRHYTRRVTADDELVIIFGDGVNGRIPPLGAGNINVTLRVGGEDNGNVGIGVIRNNADGVTGIASITNPRAAVGWRIKDGGDEFDFRRIKRDAPSQLRVRSTGTTAGDIEFLAMQEFIDSEGVKPIARAFSEEEGFGIKTVKLVCVGEGGNTLFASQLRELNSFFNGDRFATPPVKGKVTLNQQVIAINYEPALINIEATVIWSRGSAEVIKNALLAFVSPLTQDTDFSTYIWDFGTQISLSRIYNIIHEIDPNIKDIPILRMSKGSNPLAASSVQLSDNELPTTRSNSISITVLEK